MCLSRRTRLPVLYDRVGDDVDVVLVLVDFGPVDFLQRVQALRSIVGLHHLLAQAAQRVQDC